MGIILAAMGIARLKRIVTNEKVVQKMNTAGARTSKGEHLNADWLANLLFDQREWAEDWQNNSDLVREATDEVFQKEDIGWADTNIVVTPSSSLETWFPSIGCLAMQKDGVKRGPMAFDLSAACAGAVYAVAVVNAMLLADADWQYGLVVTSEIISRNLDFSDRNAGLFGDGAAAMLFKKSTSSESDRGIICSVSGSIPEAADAAYCCGHSNRVGDESRSNFYFDGRRVHSFVVNIIEDAVNAIVAKTGIKIDDIRLIVPHQASGRIAETPAKRLGIPQDRIFINVGKYGNTSTCSVPLALYEAIQQGRVKPGDLVILVGYGSGLVWGATLLRI